LEAARRAHHSEFPRGFECEIRVVECDLPRCRRVLALHDALLNAVRRLLALTELPMCGAEPVPGVLQQQTCDWQLAVNDVLLVVQLTEQLLPGMTAHAVLALSERQSNWLIRGAGRELWASLGIRLDPKTG
jgi:hypothetical protein